MGIIRDSFVIFKNWDDAIRTAPEDKQLELYHALMDYAKAGEIPENVSWEARMFLTTLQENMQQTILRYSASVSNGKLGGRPKKNENLEKPNETQENLDKPNNNLEKPSLTQPNLDEPTHNLNVNDNVNINNIKEINKEKNTVLKDSELLSLIDSALQDEDVKRKFIEYNDMRKGMGKNKAIRTLGTFNSCIKKLRRYAKSKQEAIEILEYSIGNCYQGLFDIFKRGSPPSKQKGEIEYAN